MDSVYMICSKITMKFLMLYDDDSYHWNCEGYNLHKYGNGVNENNSTKSTKIYNRLSANCTGLLTVMTSIVTWR